MSKTPKKKNKKSRPTLSRTEAQLAFDGVGYWFSDYNDAPFASLRKLQAKLIKMGAKGTVYP